MGGGIHYEKDILFDFQPHLANFLSGGEEHNQIPI